jgi:NADPH:quinone reductase-like Zn-dependent oxidoreductase
MAGMVQRYKIAGSIPGVDFAGYIERLGSDVPETSRFVGERVAGFVHGGIFHFTR